uniref:ORF3 n=1 Tax=Secalivirus TaxID=1224520 RepID=J7LG50_9CALI|nr:ORF3 [Secalivirus]
MRMRCSCIFFFCITCAFTQQRKSTYAIYISMAFLVPLIHNNYGDVTAFFDLLVVENMPIYDAMSIIHCAPSENGNIFFVEPQYTHPIRDTLECMDISFKFDDRMRYLISYFVPYFLGAENMEETYCIRTHQEVFNRLSQISFFGNLINHIILRNEYHHQYSGDLYEVLYCEMALVFEDYVLAKSTFANFYFPWAHTAEIVIEPIRPSHKIQEILQSVPKFILLQLLYAAYDDLFNLFVRSFKSRRVICYLQQRFYYVLHTHDFPYFIHPEYECSQEFGSIHKNAQSLPDEVRFAFPTLKLLAAIAITRPKLHIIPANARRMHTSHKCLRDTSDITSSQLCSLRFHRRSEAVPVFLFYHVSHLAPNTIDPFYVKTEFLYYNLFSADNNNFERHYCSYGRRDNAPTIHCSTRTPERRKHGKLVTLFRDLNVDDSGLYLATKYRLSTSHLSKHYPRVLSIYNPRCLCDNAVRSRRRII